MVDRVGCYDISVVLGEENITYPNDTPFSRQVRVTTGPWATTEDATLVMSAHGGTHLDAPAHFFPEGQRLDDFSVGEFILAARVAEIQDERVVQAEELAGVEIEPGEALLLKTDNSRSGRVTSGTFCEEFVYLSGAAAELCVARGVALVGLDYITVDRHGEARPQAHMTLLGSGKLILEGINLRAVPAGRYTLLCLPLRLKAGEGSPVRAVLLRAGENL